MKQKLLAFLAVGLLSVASFAHADTKSTSNTVTVQVDAVCFLDPIADHLLVIDNGDTTASETFNVGVKCSDQLPYYVEAAGVTAGGMLEVTDAVTNRTYQVKFTQDADGSAWGQNADGHAIVAVGDGFWQDYSVTVEYRDDQNNVIPVAGTYIGYYTSQAVF